MNIPAPGQELVAVLARAAAALDAGESDAASVEMQSAADLCRRLQAAGIGVPAPELSRLRELYDRCGVALGRMGEQLNAAGFREEHQRRGLETYQETTRRGSR